jgi:hypothetical protein
VKKEVTSVIAKEEAMSTITQKELLAKIPLAQLERAIEQFVEPVSRQLPDQRLKRVISLAVRGISAAQSPLITQMARALQRQHEGVWALSKRFYGFLANNRFSSDTLLKGLYALAVRYVAQQKPQRLVVAIDPVNFEKPYTHQLPGVSTVHKSTPPALDGQARLTKGYPAITAAVTNLAVPVITYANWFSYTLDFVSQNCEIEHAIQNTHALFPDLPLCLLGDSGLDDQKFFRLVQSLPATDCIFRAQHNRCIQVYNERADRWEDERLFDLAAYAHLPFSFQTTFTHARREHLVTVHLGWFQIRFADLPQPMWMLIARRREPDSGCPLEEGELVLLTTIPIPDARIAQRVYEEWRQRPSIEHTYRFDQEQGLDVEDMRVRSLEAMRRLFVLVLLTALFVAFLDATWPESAVGWLRSLGGKLGLPTDRDGLYLLLAGISFVFTTAATLSFACTHPFPFSSLTSG